MLMSLPWKAKPQEDSAPRRGAQPVVPGTTPDPDWYWRPLVLITLLVIFVGILSSAARDFWRWLDRPVAEIRLQGAVRHLDRQAIATDLGQQLNATLFELDLGALRQRLINDPWVHDASISRSWPPALEVQVVEEVPVARWGDKGLLNHQGDIFWPELKPEYRTLPRLSGPAHETVQIMQQFHDLNRMFAANGLRLAGLELEPRGAWIIELSNGVRVVAGRNQLIPRLRRFLTIYQLELAARAEQIEQVDIRYTNGVAVRWRAEEKSEDAG